MKRFEVWACTRPGYRACVSIVHAEHPAGALAAAEEHHGELIAPTVKEEFGMHYWSFRNGQWLNESNNPGPAE